MTTTIEVAGASATYALAMTPGGEIVGIATIGGMPNGFVFNSGSTTLLDVPGATSTTPAAVNASGVIVGSFTDGTGTHGFVDNAGSFTTLDYPGATSTFAVGINGSGDIAGYSNGPGAGAFLLSDGLYSSISVPGGTNVTAAGIDNAGQVVGFYFVSSHAEGFVDTAGSVSTISVPGSTATVATAINATGTIVGYYTDAQGNGHGFLDVDGTITTFDPPGAVSTLPLGLTDGGEVYGLFRTASGTIEEGFIGTPGTFAELALPGALVTSITGIDTAGVLAGNVQYPSAPGSTVPGPSQAILLTSLVHWVAGSGNFNTAADWDPQLVPGATNDVFIDASGAYTVTANTSEIVNTLNVAANASFVVSAGTFTVSGSLTGNATVDSGAALLLGNNSGTVSGAGQVGTTQPGLLNVGTVNANGTAGLTIDLGGGQAVQNLAGGLIEARAAGGLTIAGGTVSNAGTMAAANGSTLTLQSGVVNQNNSGGVLSRGAWEADGSGSTLAVTGGAVTVVKASIILSGAGSVFSAGDGGTFTNLEASLGSVAPIGTLALLAGRSFAATHGVADMGLIQLGGGTLTAPRLALASIGHVQGFGAITDFRYPIYNAGTIEANGGTLDVASAIDPASSGVFQLDASSFLEIAADQGAGDKMSFVGGGGELIIDDAGKFGLNVGSAGYTGPLVQNFGTGDAILLKNVAPAGLTPVYDATTGILQISNGSVSVASLAFDMPTLGTGAFHIANSGGHVLLTHS